MNRTIAYTQHGGPSVLERVQQPMVEPGDGELRIRVVVSGVNPTDWKSRSGEYGDTLTVWTVPHHDGAGIVDAVGPGVTDTRKGDRVWVTLTGHNRPASGTAQDCTWSPPNVSSRSQRLRTSTSAPASESRRARRIVH